MIFVTVGEQLPFDRLIRSVDRWACDMNLEIFAQVGKSKYIPKNIMYKKFLELNEFREKFINAEIIVAHAGMGSIITALELGKPILVMPRLAALGEHRNDHQSATIEKFSRLNFLYAAFNENDLIAKLNDFKKFVKVAKNKKKLEPSPFLIQSIREFVQR